MSAQCWACGEPWRDAECQHFTHVLGLLCDAIHHPVAAIRTTLVEFAGGKLLILLGERRL